MIDFNKLIDNYLSREKRQKQMGRYYPSEIGGCIRKTWFSYKIPKETDKDVVRIFEAGNMVHELIAEVIKSEKNPEIELVESELPFILNEKDFVVSGRIDNIILIKVNDEKALLEVKSAKFLPNEPKDNHIAQLQLYMHATGIHQGIILYIQKDNLQADWFRIDYNEKDVMNILEKFNVLHNCLKNSKLPIAEAKIEKDKNWMCSYCEYKGECDGYPIEAGKF